jgi:hypothetical protein
MRGLTSIVFGAGAALTLAGTALAQAPRSSVDTSASSGVPEFRDPKTGQIWTPLNVGQKSGPNTPQDRAFDPLAQTASINGVVVQSVPVTTLGSVPITAGPTVPIVNLEIAALRAVPDMRWQVTMYLNNNSGEAVTPIIACDFTNGGRPVEATRATLPAVGPGTRVGFVVYGPKVTLFVDHVKCRVDSP